MAADVEAPESVSTYTATDWVRLGVIGLAIIALVVGAVLVGSTPPTTAYEDAESYITSFFAENDPEGLAGNVVEEALPPLNQPLVDILGQIMGSLDGQVPQATSNTITIADREVVRVITQIPGPQGGTFPINWCVLPNGRIVVECQLAEIPVTLEDLPEGLSQEFTSGVVLPDQVQLTVGVTYGGEGVFTMAGTPEVVTQDGSPSGLEVAAAGYALGGQTAPAPASDIEIQPGVALRVLLRGSDPEIARQLAGQQLQLRWDDGAMTVRVGAPRYFLS